MSFERQLLGVAVLLTLCQAVGCENNRVPPDEEAQQSEKQAQGEQREAEYQAKRTKLQKEFDALKALPVTEDLLVNSSWRMQKKEITFAKAWYTLTFLRFLPVQEDADSSEKGKPDTYLLAVCPNPPSPAPSTASAKQSILGFFLSTHLDAVVFEKLVDDKFVKHFSVPSTVPEGGGWRAYYTNLEHSDAMGDWQILEDNTIVLGPGGKAKLINEGELFVIYCYAKSSKKEALSLGNEAVGGVFTPSPDQESLVEYSNQFESVYLDFGKSD